MDAADEMLEIVQKATMTTASAASGGDAPEVKEINNKLETKELGTGKSGTLVNGEVRAVGNGAADGATSEATNGVVDELSSAETGIETEDRGVVDGTQPLSGGDAFECKDNLIGMKEEARKRRLGAQGESRDKDDDDNDAAKRRKSGSEEELEDGFNFARKFDKVSTTTCLSSVVSATRVLRRTVKSLYILYICLAEC